MNTIINELNQECIALQGTKKEHVSYEIMAKAKDIVDNMKPSELNEVLIYCAALNTLNTYVKQLDSTITYYFKDNVVRVLLYSIVKNNISNVEVFLDYDRCMNVCYIKIDGTIMFSFHRVRFTNSFYNQLKEFKGYKRLVFDNVKKQNCAVTLFTHVKEINNYSVAN